VRRLLLSCLLLLPFPAYSWWETGHQVVARIAVMHLTPDVLRRVAHILDVENTPATVSDALAQASLWPDETKKDTNTGNWHYIDLALQDHKSDISARCENDNCVTARVRLFAAQLASKTGVDSRWSDLDALRYVVHFVGDIHQPLHDISDADQGGNCEVLDPPVVNAKNLHALWDGELVNVLGANEKAISTDLSREIDAMPSTRQAELVAGDQDDWAWEGHQLAEKEIYARLNIPLEAVVFPGKCTEAPDTITSLKLEIEPSYIEAMKPVVRGQLEKAGLRLARLLNNSLAARN
jgi:hypothetical protein